MTRGKDVGSEGFRTSCGRARAIIGRSRVSRPRGWAGIPRIAFCLGFALPTGWAGADLATPVLLWRALPRSCLRRPTRSAIAPRSGVAGMRWSSMSAALALGGSGPRKKKHDQSYQKRGKGGRAQPHAHRTPHFRVGSSGHSLLPAPGRNLTTKHRLQKTGALAFFPCRARSFPNSYPTGSAKILHRCQLPESPFAGGPERLSSVSRTWALFSSVCRSLTTAASLFCGAGATTLVTLR